MSPAPIPISAPAGVPQRAPLHPGRFLERHYLEPLAMSQTEAARRLGISRRRLNELIVGRRNMSPDTALRCAMTFGLPANQWLALQSEWDSYHAWKSLRGRLLGRGKSVAEARTPSSVAPAASPSPASSSTRSR